MSDLAENLSHPADASPHLNPGDEGVSMPQPLPRIALLYADPALMTHVGDALNAMTAPIVYRASIDLVDASALTAAQPAVALINLDDRCDANLDVVTAMLDEACVPVVFNDADISRGLEGWARARWARHLAAKLCGSADVDPPRPSSLQPLAMQVPTLLPVAAAAGFDAIETPDSGSRPLTQNEIESLVADFPTEAALAAHVDALLANASEPVHGPAAWEVASIASVDEPAAATNDTTAQTLSQPIVETDKTTQVEVPSPERWQLLDDSSVLVAAPRAEVKPQAPASALSRDDIALELEPLEQVAASAAQHHERECEEIRLEEKTAARKRKAKS